MAKISYIDTSANQPQSNSFSIPTDESIGAMLFDVSGFDNPFGFYPLLYNNFKDNKVQRVTNMDDASTIGISDDGFLNGLLYHHLSQFYDFVGGDQTIYIMIADCGEDWEAIQSLHQKVNGKVFQIGIWTSQPIWRRKSDGSLGFTNIITDLQKQADEINGEIGKATYTMAPVSLLLFGNSAYIAEGELYYKELPDAVELNCPKVSVILAQNGSAENKLIQSKNPLNAPVGSMGLAMACLALAGAEESIACVGKYDLNKNEGFNYPEWGVGNEGCPMQSVNRIWANLISERGYIIPMDYEGEEASYYFSSDQTLSSGDFSSIANNRVMHKCRRAMSTALLPYINSNHIYDASTKTISNTAMAILTSGIYSILDTVMKNNSGNNQIDARDIKFLQDTDLLETDTIALRLTVKPANYSDNISEDVAHDVIL